MTTGDVVHVAFRGTLYNSRWQTGFHLRYNDEVADAADAAANVSAQLLTALQGACGDDVNIDSIRVQSVRVDGEESLELALPANTNGTIVGASPPGQCPAIISLRTGLKGRRRRGRMFIPAGITAQIIDAKFGGASLTGLQTLAGAISAAYATGGTETARYQGCIYSPADPTFQNKKGEFTRPAELLTYLTNCQPSEFCKTLHRRAIGVGE